MLRRALDEIFDELLRCRRLLDHPFYRRWEAGELAPAELTAYAGQYRHFEQLLPSVLEHIVEGIDDVTARSLVQANLNDELGNPIPHASLFERFAQAVGAGAAVDRQPATTALVTCYRDAAVSDPVAALAALGAYEVQSPSIASSKGAGLRAHYGLTDDETRFWDVHGVMDRDHASWTLDALAIVAKEETVYRAGRAAADAWWSFLDEREAAA